MSKRKWLLTALGAIIFVGVGLPVAGNQSEVEFRLAEHARDSCYADAGYGDRNLDASSRPPPTLVEKCTQPIRDWEGREPLRIAFGALAGLIALLPYLAILWVLGRRRRSAQPA